MQIVKRILNHRLFVLRNRNSHYSYSGGTGNSPSIGLAARAK